MRPKSTTLTAQELEIMKLVWERERVTVRDVYQALLEKRKVAYTTVMTMMNILEQKGHLSKESGDKAFVYTPTRSQRDVTRHLVGDFIERVFNGSVEPLFAHLIKDHPLSRQEIEEIERLLKERKS
ncbi:MAG: BlaI/MecI/CopY family transcriptional regulator [Bryobacteraceae bacterium]|nr:BlaI/MecI/CopY family transcriptional regulator [Bryobacteraceae bacterium]